MSGGHWGYLSSRFGELADRVKDDDYNGKTERSLRLLGEIEHVLDWGICSDTCYRCSRRQAIRMLEEFFDNHMNEVPDYGSGYHPAMMCKSCLLRVSTEKPNNWLKAETIKEAVEEVIRRKEIKDEEF